VIGWKECIYNNLFLCGMGHEILTHLIAWNVFTQCPTDWPLWDWCYYLQFTFWVCFSTAIVEPDFPISLFILWPWNLNNDLDHWTPPRLWRWDRGDLPYLISRSRSFCSKVLMQTHRQTRRSVRDACSSTSLLAVLYATYCVAVLIYLYSGALLPTKGLTERSDCGAWRPS